MEPVRKTRLTPPRENVCTRQIPGQEKSTSAIQKSPAAHVGEAPDRDHQDGDQCGSLVGITKPSIRQMPLKKISFMVRRER